MELTLYYQSGTRSQRVRWLLEELELNYKLEYIDLFKGQGNTPEYLAMHPLGQLPVLIIDGSVMFESGAIVHWLADIHPEKGFAPALDSPQRREFNQWMYFSVTSLETPAWEIILHRQILPEDVAIKPIVAFATRNLIKVLTVLDKQLQGKNFMLGNKFSAADIMIGYTLLWFPEQLEKFSNLKAYTTELQRRPAYIRSKQN